jgi:hypothetical protein
VARYGDKFRKRLSAAVMSQEQLRNALIRAVVLEYRNGQSRAFPRWGWEKPTSMYVLRARRLSLAREYARKHQPVSDFLFARRLPKGREWPGTRQLISAPIYAWVDDVWAHIGCTVPIKHSRGIAGQT